MCMPRFAKVLVAFLVGATLAQLLHACSTNTCSVPRSSALRTLHAALTMQLHSFVCFRTGRGDHDSLTPLSARYVRADADFICLFLRGPLTLAARRARRASLAERTCGRLP